MSRSRFVPQYQLIYEDLKKKIEEGVYAPGAQLPFERELSEQYGVERITVRKSLSLLVQDGLIDKRAGLGSFVHQNTSDQARKASDTILFVMRKNQNDIRSNASAFNAQMFFPMEQVCSEKGFTLLYTGLSPEDDIAEPVRRHNVAGIFLVSTLAQNVYQRVRDLDVPAVCINHLDSRFMSVMPDNYSGVHAAMEELFTFGHRKIAYVNGMKEAINASERFTSYYMALCLHGESLRPEWIMNGEWTYDSGFAQMSQLLHDLPARDYPTAVVAASDMMAIGCIDAIKKAGLRVPEDISVIGFDDIDMSRFCTPQLTTVRTDSASMARIAFDHLSRSISCTAGEDKDKYVIRLPAKLIRRQSVASIGEE